MTASLRYLLAAATLALAFRTIEAQVTIVSAPKDPSLLQVTRQWSRASLLGDLRENANPVDASDIEVRAWGGYGLTGTEAVVLRREGGVWHALYARVVACSFLIPIPVGDTASERTIEHYKSEARRKCGGSLGNVSAGARVIDADTLAVTALAATSDEINGAWNNAVRSGLLSLPAQVPRKWMMMDGFTYVLEVRRGHVYRASEIAHRERPEVAADTQVKHVVTAIWHLDPRLREQAP